jgi:hypothetical protein
VRVLLWLYPRGWRRRYHAEMEAMLERTPFTWRGALDLVRGVVDAHLHPPYASRGRRLAVSAAGFALLVALGALALTLVAGAAGRVPLGPLAGRLLVCACWAVLAVATRLAGARLLSRYLVLLAARLTVSVLTGLAPPRLAAAAIVTDAGLGAAIALVFLLRASVDWRPALVLVAVLSLLGPDLLAPGHAGAAMTQAGPPWSSWPAYLEGLRYALWAAVLAACAAGGRRRPGPGWDWPAAGAMVPRRPSPEPDGADAVAAATRSSPTSPAPAWPATPAATSWRRWRRP